MKDFYFTFGFGITPPRYNIMPHSDYKRKALEKYEEKHGKFHDLADDSSCTKIAVAWYKKENGNDKKESEE